MHHKIYWTSEIEALFIQLVAEQPHLYDPRNQNYIRKTMRIEGFRDIADMLKERWPDHVQLFTPEIMSNKFSKLRSNFRREQKIAQRIRSRTGSEDYVPKWEHYARLRFLEKVPSRSSRNRSSGSAPMDISESDDSDVSSPDTELDCTDRPGTSGSKFRLSLRPFGVEEEPQESIPKNYQSSDDSSNEDYPVVSTNYLTEYFRQDPPADPTLSPLDIQKKNALDMAFCRYLNTMLSPIPDCLQKELAKIKITETILKLKFPLV